MTTGHWGIFTQGKYTTTTRLSSCQEEDGKRSISLVTLEHGKDAVIHEIDIAPASFEKVRVPLTNEESLQDIMDAINSAIETTKTRFDTELLIVRIVLEGNSASMNIATIFGLTAWTSRMFQI